MTTQPKQTTRSEEVVRKHKEYLWPAVTNFYKQPLVADHASMQYVWDVEGRKYLDFFGGILTISVGHANPKITGPVKAQVDRLQHLSTLYPNEPSSRWPKKSRRSLRARCSPVFSPVPAPRRMKPRSCWRAWPPARTTLSRCATPIPADRR